jgi:hypothetical protein
VDAARAKQILSGHHCLLIRVPPLSSRVWSLREIESFIKDIFDKYGKKGGVLFNIRLPKKGSTSEFQAMLQSLREHTRY